MYSDPPYVPPERAGTQYRLYFLDGLGHITKSHEYFAGDDAEAIKIAEAWRSGRAMELWSRHRKVKHWDSGSNRAPD